MSTSFAQYLVEQLDALIYLVDMQTCEVLYINERGKKLFGPGDVVGQACYRVLQGRDEPCPFCTNHLLVREFFHVWEHTNPITGRHYLLKDKLVDWRGKTVRMEVAVDITDKENTSRAIKDKLEMQRALVDCVRTFYTAPTFNEAINIILRILGRIHQADRAYVFEYTSGERDEVFCSNTHEWCAEGVAPQKDKLQDLSLDLLPDWKTFLGPEQSIVIRDLEEIRENFPQTYDILKMQEIRSLMISQLNVDGVASGFIGVDNPRHLGEDLSLLWSLSYFVTMEQKKQRMESNILFLSQYDSLTGVGNRHSYMRLLSELESAENAETGVAFVDLNGLKSLNDREGHTAGDIFLKRMSEVFARHFSKEELFRIGGDKFVIICRGISAQLFKKKLRSMRAEAENLYPGALALGSVWKKSEASPSEMARLADKRMYEDKRRHYHDRNRELRPVPPATATQ